MRLKWYLLDPEDKGRFPGKRFEAKSGPYVAEVLEQWSNSWVWTLYDLNSGYYVPISGDGEGKGGRGFTIKQAKLAANKWIEQHTPTSVKFIQGLK